jgi:hypothetical protein
MPAISLDIAGPIELAELLQFIGGRLDAGAQQAGLSADLSLE